LTWPEGEVAKSRLTELSAHKRKFWTERTEAFKSLPPGAELFGSGGVWESVPLGVGLWTGPAGKKKSAKGGGPAEVRSWTADGASEWWSREKKGWAGGVCGTNWA